MSADVASGCACGDADAARLPATASGVEDAVADAVFKALASSPRRQLLRMVASGTSADGSCCPTEVCACQLADALELAPSTISHHMSVLVKAGLVTATKRGLWVYYGLRRDVLGDVARDLAGL